MESSQPIHIGVLHLPYNQLLDAAGPMDYLNNHSRSFLEAFISPLAPLLLPHRVFCRSLHAPATYADCPSLDHHLVPAADPATPLLAGTAEFIRSSFEGLKGLLTVCAGSLAVVPSRVLDGLQVCSNKMILKTLAEVGMLPKNIKWLGDRRWFVDGKVWSAAGVTAGIDSEIVEAVKLISEYDPNPFKPDISRARVVQMHVGIGCGPAESGEESGNNPKSRNEGRPHFGLGVKSLLLLPIHRPQMLSAPS
ncbi:hypothetical protein BDQ12DRAFT_724364 [Crucibulum laeve]|uniref:Class I glutamine amidotransferase-like protein n=1 Tax=Crucibulum laeve TaxID=68775 RepID=A0A5C3LVP9_9AGAR|nr:hypothetical protein BDQ12DRAFT_724364 [Crucibulum laeve]